MNFEAVRLQSWYATPLGRAVAGIVGEIMEKWLRPKPVERTFGLGFIPPYMEFAISGRAGAIGAAPAEMGVAKWPNSGHNRISLVRPDALPFPDESFDRVVMTHLLEGTESPREALREAWRVVKPGGRIFIMVPNRGGLWARRDSTPFGWGRPFSPRQLRALLEEVFFVPRQSRFALFMPPFAGRRMIRGASAWEKAGQRWFSWLGGVILCEAEKVVYAAPPLKVAPPRLARSRPLVWPVAEGNRSAAPRRDGG